MILDPTLTLKLPFIPTFNSSTPSPSPSPLTRTLALTRVHATVDTLPRVQPRQGEQVDGRALQKGETGHIGNGHFLHKSFDSASPHLYSHMVLVFLVVVGCVCVYACVTLF